MFMKQSFELRALAQKARSERTGAAPASAAPYPSERKRELALDSKEGSRGGKVGILIGRTLLGENEPNFPHIP
ncbi:hypothetical protein SDJN03_19179, partial [Cucurbita argyrosperma subsp. sororia]